jgi:hypothetical protein
MARHQGGKGQFVALHSISPEQFGVGATRGTRRMSKLPQVLQDRPRLNVRHAPASLKENALSL